MTSPTAAALTDAYRGRTCLGRQCIKGDDAGWWTRSQLGSYVSESRRGRPGLPVPNSPYGLCGRKAKLNSLCDRTQEPCESQGGRPGLTVPNSP